jgi:hypothetical protein
MFDHIVAIVDGSPTSHFAIGASITIAREDGDDLAFCVTIDPELSADGVGGACFAELGMQLSREMLDAALQRRTMAASFRRPVKSCATGRRAASLRSRGQSERVSSCWVWNRASVSSGRSFARWPKKCCAKP